MFETDVKLVNLVPPNEHLVGTFILPYVPRNGELLHIYMEHLDETYAFVVIQIVYEFNRIEGGSINSDTEVPARVILNVKQADQKDFKKI